MNKLPKYPHLRKKEYMENVYEPSEDTFILMESIDMLLKEASFSTPSVCIEIGVGLGLVITYAAQVLSAPPSLSSSADLSSDISFAAPQLSSPPLQPSSTLFIGTELNPVALRAARETASLNGVGDRIELVQCDLCSPLLARLAHSVDLLLVNPPYVPHEADTQLSSSTWIDCACLGGIDGNGTLLMCCSLIQPHAHPLLPHHQVFVFSLVKA